jgi:prepilin-type N-terminal cleavage/methylation domain-containing protein
MSRKGFTLIELLIAIFVIAVLMTLMFPAINSVMSRVRVSQVRTEISNLEGALTAFKVEYGMYPPSHMVLRTRGLTVQDWDMVTVANIRKMWPQFRFDESGGWTGIWDTQLNGAECLVLFLGGVGSRDSSGNWVLTPLNPNGWFPFRGNAEEGGEFFKFDTSRLVDVNGNGFPEYLDPIPGQVTPYLYLSSNGGNRYRYDMDINMNGVVDAGEDRNGNGVFDYPDASVFAVASLNLKEAYRNGDGYDSVAYNDGTFQLISAGFNQVYGVGGGYVPEMLFPANRLKEGDNITNFTPGMLGR